MAKSGNSKDKIKKAIVEEEMNSFNNLIKDHKKILVAIGNL